MTSNIGSRRETSTFPGLDYEFNFEYVKVYASGSARGKEPAGHCRRHKNRVFDPWVGNIPLKGVATHPSILA